MSYLINIVQSSLQSSFQLHHLLKLYTSPECLTLIASRMSENTTRTDHQEAQTRLLDLLHHSKGFPPAWASKSTPELSSSLVKWTDQSLTVDHLPRINESLVLKKVALCCNCSFSRRNLETLFYCKDFKKLVTDVVNKKFENRPYGNYLNKDEIHYMAMGTLFNKLATRSGFPDKLLSYSTSHAIATLRMWMYHRILDELKRGQDDRMVHTDDFSAPSTKEGSVQGLENDFLQKEQDTEKSIYLDFVLSIPIICIHVASMEAQQFGWNLFLKLNDDNLLDWLMSDPTYYSYLETFNLLSLHASTPLSVINTWRNNVSTLSQELENSPTSRGTKTKEFALLARNPQIPTIEQVRQHPDISTMRETLRRRNNNTDAGLKAMCILALLTVKANNSKGVLLLQYLFQHYLQSAINLHKVNDWPFNTQEIISWSVDTRSISEARADIYDMIAKMRYKKTFASLSKNQTVNVKQIMRQLKLMGDQISDGLTPLSKR